MPRLLAALLLLVLLAPLVRAEDVPSAGEPTVQDRWVEAALQESGANAAELRTVLEHFADDPRKLVAARYLIANMPGKGYITTELRTQAGEAIPYDPLAYTHFKDALEALEALEKEHGELDFARDHKVEDVKTIRAAFLIEHIDLAFEGWERMPPGLRVGFRPFLEHVLPYRGSQEPLDNWRKPLMRRYAGRLRALADGTLSAQELYAWLSKDVHKRVRFNERYYLHPTDQGFTEMGRSGQGRCEDITNMMTFAARSMALASAADYTPAWAHRDNNHAWNVLLDKDGKGSAKGNAHAAKVYRKTYALQRGNLAFELPEGREAPNRFLASTNYVDVTDQYAPTTEVRIRVAPAHATSESHAYLCVFNGGSWVAIHWSRIADGEAVFDRMGRNIVYLPMIHDGSTLVATSAPLIVHKDGSIEALGGALPGTRVTAVAVSPKKVSPDTFEVTPVNYLKAGTTYVLKRWNLARGAWDDVREIVGAEKAPSFEDLAPDGLYWLVAKESRRLERIWTVGPKGFQRWW